MDCLAANQISIANLLLTTSFHGHLGRDRLAGDQFTPPPHFFFFRAVPISLKFSEETRNLPRGIPRTTPTYRRQPPLLLFYPRRANLYFVLLDIFPGGYADYTLRIFR